MIGEIFHFILWFFKNLLYFYLEIFNILDGIHRRNLLTFLWWKKNSQSQGAQCWGRTHWTVSHHFTETAVKVHRCCFHQGILLRCLWDPYTNSFSQINFFLRKNEIRKETSCNEHHTSKFWISGREADKRNSNRFISSLPDPGLCLHYHVILRYTIHIPLMSPHFKGPGTAPRALC